LLFAFHSRRKAAVLRDGAIDPTRIEAKKVEVFPYNLIQVLSCSLAVVHPTCYDISVIAFLLGRIINVTTLVLQD
jgi:hypothetical protein